MSISINSRAFLVVVLFSFVWVALFRYRSIRALATPISLSLNTAPHVRYFARWAQYAHVGLFLPPLEKNYFRKKTS